MNRIVPFWNIVSPIMDFQDCRTDIVIIGAQISFEGDVYENKNLEFIDPGHQWPNDTVRANCWMRRQGQSPAGRPEAATSGAWHTVQPLAG
ncbi:MAG: hypothetical protein A2W25_17430 [candidate division Zixibacteria bacterium RBG_16_53_22]|nr:MAG: hypothetical protein A2W25_17430 [candidate division Zixibacteria bacterium RBG_16_53_22]